MCGGFLGKVGKSLTLPFDTIKASDPFTQWITGNKVDFNADHNLDAALNEGYDDDPIGGSLLTKDDYKRTGKVAAAAAALFFGGGAALNAAGGGSTAAGAGALDAGSLTAEDALLAPGVEGATASGVGASASDIAGLQGVGGTGAGLTAAADGTSTLGASLGSFNNYTKLASGLYDMYSANKKSKALQGQADTLANMYQPGTPEYDQWKQQLDRRDAASGRRSQYGPRSVELAAAMAKQRAGIMTSPMYGQYLGGALDNKYGGLNSLFKNASSVYGAAKDAPKMYNDISNWFSGGSSAGNAATSNFSLPDETYEGIGNYLF